MDDAAGFRPVIVAQAALAAQIALPDNICLVTPEQAPDAAAHLAAFDTAAVLLRADRYILGCADTAQELVALLPLLSNQPQQKEIT